MITGTTRVFGLLGHPVRHSLSPAMHNELFRRKRIDAVYAVFDVQPEHAGQVPAAIRTLGLAGVNLTVPFKEAVVSDLDALSPTAAATRAVNVVVADGGRLVGHNTDGIGYLRALQHELGVQVQGARCAILGAGGTARAVGFALGEAGAAEVWFYNRSLERADRAREALRGVLPACRFGSAALDRFSAAAEGVDVVVNCTAGAAADRVAAIDTRGLRVGSVWTDANYWMSEPPQMRACAARGVRIQTGIGMLVYQGAESFRLFTGVGVDGDTVRGVLNLGGW